jgi:hypothetical protein
MSLYSGGDDVFKKILSALRHPVGFTKLLYEDIKAWKHGKQRITPRIGINGELVRRGRVYGTETKGFSSASKKSVRCDMKVIRANGKVEHYVSDKNGFRRTR